MQLICLSVEPVKLRKEQNICSGESFLDQTYSFSPIAKIRMQCLPKFELNNDHYFKELFLHTSRFLSPEVPSISYFQSLLVCWKGTFRSNFLFGVGVGCCFFFFPVFLLIVSSCVSFFLLK